MHFASSSLCTVAESNGRAIARLLRSGSSRISEGMATSTASSIAGNARAVVSSSVGEDTVAQVDQLAASWGLDRSNAIREILETVIAREKMQKEVLLRRFAIVAHESHDRGPSALAGSAARLGHRRALY